MTGIRAPKPPLVVGNSQAKPVVIRKGRQDGEKQTILMKGIGFVQKQENLPVGTVSCFTRVSESNTSLKSLCSSTELYGRITISIKG